MSTKVRKVVIDAARCKGCNLCVLFCEGNSLKNSKIINKLGVYPVEFCDEQKCNSCGLCYIICPEYCIEVFKVDKGS